VLNRAIDGNSNLDWTIAVFVHNDPIQVWWDIDEGKLSFAIAIRFPSLGSASFQLNEHPRGRRTQTRHPQLADNRDRIGCLLRPKEWTRQTEKNRGEESSPQRANHGGKGSGLPHQKTSWEKNKPEPV
jgi:hypothetical protein